MDDFVYVTLQQGESIREVLTRYNKDTSDEIINLVFHHCEAYLTRGKANRKPLISELKKFQLDFTKIYEALSDRSHLEINHILDQFNEDLSKYIDKLSKRKQQSYARDLFIIDLFNIYETVTGKKPGKPHYKDKQEKLYRGPSFEFVSDILTVIDGHEPHSPTLKSAVNKVLNSLNPKKRQRES